MAGSFPGVKVGSSEEGGEDVLLELAERPDSPAQVVE
jgi:hypothetical protein